MHLEVTIVLKETPTNDDGLLLTVMRVGSEVNCLENEIKSFMEKLTAGGSYPALDRALLINASASWGNSGRITVCLGKPLTSFLIRVHGMVGISEYLSRDHGTMNSNQFCSSYSYRWRIGASY